MQSYVEFDIYVVRSPSASEQSSHFEVLFGRVVLEKRNEEGQHQAEDENVKAAGYVGQRERVLADVLKEEVGF